MKPSMQNLSSAHTHSPAIADAMLAERTDSWRGTTVCSSHPRCLLVREGESRSLSQRS